MFSPCFLFGFGGVLGCSELMFLSFFLEPGNPWTACSFLFSFKNEIWDFCITHWSKKLRRRWRKTSSTVGLKFQEFATLIIFCFLSVFQRKRKPSSISLSTSSVNKNIRCFREGSNCEEKGFHIPFLLDYLKVVSRAAFWNSCSALREQSCVGEAVQGGLRPGQDSGCSCLWLCSGLSNAKFSGRRRRSQVCSGKAPWNSSSP